METEWKYLGDLKTLRLAKLYIHKSNNKVRHVVTWLGDIIFDKEISDLKTLNDLINHYENEFSPLQLWQLEDVKENMKNISKQS
jgi:hypothetical protein